MLNAGPAIRHRCRRIAAQLLLVLLTAAPACEAVRGGEMPYGNPLLASQPVQVVAESADGDSYWIVSTRRAAQHRLDPPSNTFDFIRRQEDGTFVTSSGAAMQAEFQPGVPVIIFVHGSFVSWQDQLNQACTTNRW